MDEKPSAPTMEALLRGIEPRVLLDLTFQLGAAPEQFRSLAGLALSEGRVRSEVLIPLQEFVEHEQRMVPRKSRMELEGYVASVVIAHAWQDENTKARRNHKKSRISGA